MAAGRRGKASPRRTGKRLEVWKFGGTALADANAVRNAVELIKAHGGPLVVVVSALSGVTDSLLDGSRQALTGDTQAAAAASAAMFQKCHAAKTETPGASKLDWAAGIRHPRRLNGSAHHLQARPQRTPGILNVARSKRPN